MADKTALDELLDRAGTIFTMAGNLDNAFWSERNARVATVGPSAWSRHADIFAEFCEALLELRDQIQKPPSGFEEVAEQLMKAARLAKGIRDAMNKDGGKPAMYRGGGSIGIIGAARAAWIVGTDPDDSKVRVLAMN